MTTKVSQHIFETASILRNKRYVYTTDISILIRGNVSYGLILRVQKGQEGFLRRFYEEFSKNPQKNDQNEKKS